MNRAYGLIEIQGVAAAIDAIDVMSKSADVDLLTWERKLGGRLVTVIIQGDVGAVRTAIDAAIQGGIKKPVVTGVIANPHEEIVKLANSSFMAKRRDE